MVGLPWLCASVTMVTFLTTAFGFRCKWSNEGCTSGEECCSGSCMQPHPGTNSRCTKCTIRGDCLYSYHCENRLICGAHRECCADYWETCANVKDCCDPEHKCVTVIGFVYRKCLYGPVRITGSSSYVSAYPCIIVLAFIFFVFLNF